MKLMRGFGAESNLFWEAHWLWESMATSHLSFVYFEGPPECELQLIFKYGLNNRKCFFILFYCDA